MTAALALLALWAVRDVRGVQEIAAATSIQEQMACAPVSQFEPPAAGLRVLSGYVHGRIMFGPGEPLIINAGTNQGLKPGQQYFVRRQVDDRFTPATAHFHLISVHTAGWVTIVEARERISVATVTHACDGILEGDYLEPFVDPVVPSPAVGGEPDFAHPARLVMADERRQTGYAGLVMIIDRGTDSGVRAGQTLTIYRETVGGEGPIIDLGRATVLEAGAVTSLVRIDSSREAVYIGDLAAIHRLTP
jgi:hypothetical protein